MTIPIPYAFLSLSGHDDDFVSQVHEHLPTALAFFYRKSFENGAKLLEEMERGVQGAAIFVLFASKSSIESKWVGFEIDEARIRKITNPGFRVLVVPVEPQVTVHDLPRWMQAYWVGDIGRTPNDVARYIRNVLAEAAGGASSARVIGRGGLTDALARRVFGRGEATGTVPNVLVLPGLAGIGRKTFAKESLRSIYTNRPNLHRGPVLVLPQYCDIGDVYRKLREIIEPTFGIKKFEESWSIFSNLSEDDQVAEVIRSLKYFGVLDQSVTLSVGNGLFHDDGTVKSWVLQLFRLLASDSKTFLSIASNRQINETLLRKHENVVQLFVPPLSDPDIRALVAATFVDYGDEPLPLPSALIQAIGGHPDVAKSAVRLVKQFGAAIIEKQPHLLFHVQEEILAENLNVSSLSKTQSEILSILSWVPQLSDKLLMETLSASSDFSEEEIIYALQDLVLSCIVQIAGDKYYISSAIRMMFRRAHGYGDAELLKRFSLVLSGAWEKALDGEEELSTDLLDSFVFMHALEGRTLPAELRQILSPAVLVDLIADVYNRARDNSDLYDRVISWAGIADDLKCDENTREEILSYLSRAYIRRREYARVVEILGLFEARGYRSRHFLRGFYLRARSDYAGAIPVLYKAVKERKFKRAAVHELALCLYREKRGPELQELIDDNRQWLDDSAFLLDFLIGTRISTGDFKDIDVLLQKLRGLPDDDGRSVRREAQLLMKRNFDYAGAERLLTRAIQGGIGSAVAMRATRAEAAAYSGQYDTARKDIDFIERQRGKDDLTALRLAVHLLLAQKKYEDAIEQLDSVPKPDPVDQNLRAKVLEAQANDPLTPLSERNGLVGRAHELRAQNPPSDDIHIELGY